MILRLHGTHHTPTSSLINVVQRQHLDFEHQKNQGHLTQHTFLQQYYPSIYHI